MELLIGKPPLEDGGVESAACTKQRVWASGFQTHGPLIRMTTYHDSSSRTLATRTALPDADGTMQSFMLESEHVLVCSVD